MNWKILGLDPEFLKDFKKITIAILAAIAVGRFVGGPVLALISLLGIQYASSKKTGYAVICYLLIPFLTNLAGQLVSHGNAFMAFNKICSVAMMGMMIMLANGGRGKKKLPITLLFAYLVVAAISSMQGWCPIISYLKLILFTLFLIGIIFMASAMQNSERALIQVRAAFMAFSVVLILGSFVTLFVPGIGYSMYNRFAFNGESITFEELGDGLVLFSGVTLHSQALAPMIACFNAWVLCDMLFVQKRFTKLHLMMLVLAPFLLYKTHSRTGLVAYIGSMAMIIFFSIPKARMTAWFKLKVMKMMYGMVALLVLVSIVMEINNHTISSWLRKRDASQVVDDDRGLMEAITASRQDSNNQNLHDFHQNPLLGMGFQTMEWHAVAYHAGTISIWSAPIEKGVMPLMILGETGVVGAIVFVAFLFCFYGVCFTQRYAALMSTFTAVLVSNLGEATFFSPTATGGIVLVEALVGGFCIDLLSQRQNRMAMPFQFRALYPMQTPHFVPPQNMMRPPHFVPPPHRMPMPPVRGRSVR